MHQRTTRHATSHLSNGIGKLLLLRSRKARRSPLPLVIAKVFQIKLGVFSVVERLALCHHDDDDDDDDDDNGGCQEERNRVPSRPPFTPLLSCSVTLPPYLVASAPSLLQLVPHMHLYCI